MKITSACIYALDIPFRESFSHSLSERSHSDSIMVMVETESGIRGFGEGVPRQYVTGETRKGSIEHIKNDLLPRIIGVELSGWELKRAFAEIDERLGRAKTQGAIVWHASRCAVESAIADCLFRSRNASVNEALPPVLQTVVYSGVISAGSTAKVEKIARQCAAAGFKHIKMKVSGKEDVERVAAARDIMGRSTSIRLDANAAFDPETAIRFLKSVKRYDIECIEQPIPRGDAAELEALRSLSPIPIMADESMVTLHDAEDLIKKKAVDYFNLRISKCGGLHNTLVIAELAQSAGIGIQLGCHVGETAVLSAAGRHFAARVKSLCFVEGSYGVHLLAEDVSEENIVFGPGGNAPLLTGDGLGITVRESLLDKYAKDKTRVL